jgi:hypothetical protein
MMSEFVELVQVEWKHKTKMTGTVLSELCENLYFADETTNASRPHDAQTISAYCRAMEEQYSSSFTNPPHILSLLSFVLYTQQDVDIDRMFSFTDVPEFPVGQESPAARDKVYADYREQVQTTGKRNPMIFRNANWGSFMSWDAYSKGVENPLAMEALRTWVKWICLITASRLHYPPRSVFRGLCGLPPQLVEEFRNMEPGKEIFWPALSSTTTERSICESYANQAEPLERNVIFTISGVNEGIELFRLSQYPKEAEFLLPSFSKLRVVNVQKDTVPLIIDCEFAGCIMPDDFRQACLDDLEQSMVEMQNSITARADQAEDEAGGRVSAVSGPSQRRRSSIAASSIGDAACANKLRELYPIFGLCSGSNLSHIFADLTPVFLITFYSIWTVITKRFLAALQSHRLMVKTGDAYGQEIFERKLLWSQDPNTEWFQGRFADVHRGRVPEPAPLSPWEFTANPTSQPTNQVTKPHGS